MDINIGSDCRTMLLANIVECIIYIVYLSFSFYEQMKKVGI